MPRPARFTRLQILDSARDIVADGGFGAATIGAISEHLDAPTGSIYHRFASREELLAELWLDVVTEFESGFVATLAADTEDAGLRAALFTPRWAREHPRDARVLLLHSREDLLADRWPEAVRARAEQLRVEPERALRRYCRRRFGRVTSESIQRTVFAIVDVPKAAVTRYLRAGSRVPPLVDDLVELTYQAVLEDT